MSAQSDAGPEPRAAPAAEAGNTALRYKDALNDLERHAPGTKAAFLFGYLDRARDEHFGRADEAATVVACVRCGQPTGLREGSGNQQPVCAFCRTRDRVLAVVEPSRGRVEASA